jgi:hypothetical protein
MRGLWAALVGVLATGGLANGAQAGQAEAVEVPSPPPPMAVVPPAAPSNPVAPQPATASDYPACDGYPAPNPRKKLRPGDTQPEHRGWGGLGPNYGIRLRSFGVQGSAACERTLADPMLVPEFRNRRLSLLRARALHELAEKSDATALATLDELDAFHATYATPEELAATRLGSDALRAIALYRTKKSTEAQKMLDSIVARRPFSPSVRRMASAIRLLFDTDRGNRIAQLREQASYNPVMLRLMLMIALQTGDFENAALYADQISFDLPKSRGGWTLSGDDDRKYDEIQDRAAIRGARAYALLASGKTEQSAIALKGARDEVAFAVEPPPPRPDGRKQPKRVEEDYRRRVAAGDKATAVLDDWSRAIALRLRASKLTMKALSDEPERPRGEAMVVMSDLIAQLRAEDPAEARAIDATIDQIRRMQDLGMTKMLQLGFGDLVKLLPRGEHAAAKPKMRDEGSNFWRTDMEGYRVMKSDDPQLVNLRMGSLSASPAMVEEAAMLVAADHVRGLGKDAFVIESAVLVERTVTYGYGYSAGGGTPQGFEYRLLIRPISLAAGEEPSRQWRAIKAADVRAALAEKYPPAQ